MYANSTGLAFLFLVAGVSTQYGIFKDLLIYAECKKQARISCFLSNVMD
jgi:hypothetical protein